MLQGEKENYVVENGGERLDVYLTRVMTDFSRARLQQLIKDSQVMVNGKIAKSSLKLESGDTVNINIPPPEKPLSVEAENIPLTIIYQDADIAVINKQAGLVVHPGSGNWTGTLVNALMHHITDLSGIGGELRPGLVHRLDKDTSGLMLVAKNDIAHRILATMIEERKVKREYLALAWGIPQEDTFTVDQPLGRDPHDRQRMAVIPESSSQTSRRAVTHFTVMEKFLYAALIRAELETGRTHQVRVHLNYHGNPVIGDPVYGVKTGKQALQLFNAEDRNTINKLPGQALHATRLTFEHPTLKETMTFEVSPPKAFEKVLILLRK
jgi:23S rRNA pseudouridine1911/1915/1917 synthase